MIIKREKVDALCTGLEKRRTYGKRCRYTKEIVN